MSSVTSWNATAKPSIIGGPPRHSDPSGVNEHWPGRFARPDEQLGEPLSAKRKSRAFPRSPESGANSITGEIQAHPAHGRTLLAAQMNS